MPIPYNPVSLMEFNGFWVNDNKYKKVPELNNNNKLIRKSLDLIKYKRAQVINEATGVVNENINIYILMNFTSRVSNNKPPRLKHVGNLCMMITRENINVNSSLWKDDPRAMPSNNECKIKVIVKVFDDID